MITYAPYTLQIQFDWNLKIDPIYRILDDEKWMNNFFKTGEIMLSCFKNFKKNPDEMQGDRNEGEGIIGGEDEEGNHNYIIYNSGLKAYIMSSTKELNKDVIKDFNGKCAIKILNPTLFAFEISKKLPFVASGLEGTCNYKSYRTNIYKKEQTENKIFQEIDFQNDPNSSEKIKAITMGNELFLKLEKYKHQREYRLIWFSNQEVNESILIKCPEAIRFCEPIIFDID